MGRCCDFCGFSVEENGDFVEWQDGTICCDHCQPDFEPSSENQCEICGDVKFEDQFVDMTPPLVCADCLHAGVD